MSAPAAATTSSLGGATPADSPFLRRPDLLASIIAYWQNHPSLSYLFCGPVRRARPARRRASTRRATIPSTSWRSRSRRSPSRAGASPPWLVDRLFRNLLVDVTGNTHRAEICIDKLYAPDGPMGRLGLVEFRAFEMPPHPRMSLAQQLLIRALVAWFWERPYRQPLVRWGTALHDRFMLPHFLWADFESVIADLERRAACRSTPSGSRPISSSAFRCWARSSRRASRSSCARRSSPGWCSASRATAGGTTRTVDSSLDRLQVRVAGPRGDRYLVTCNGYPLPLAPTGRRAKRSPASASAPGRPPEGFHPTITPHVPLTFDIFDTWTGRSIGGCRYHAAHPGGRIFQARPVNALEAEGAPPRPLRADGPLAGRAARRRAACTPTFPLTLDLRRVG